LSYDIKYKEWVEKHLQGTQESGESYELFEVYREIPVLRVKERDDPPRYRFMAPILNNMARDIDRIHSRIDRRLDKAPKSRDREKAPKKDADRKDSDVDYFLKWQNCQVELMDMKKREEALRARVEDLQAKVNELSAVQQKLKKEAAELRNQLKNAEKIISDNKRK
jgi:hypothetical protein